MHDKYLTPCKPSTPYYTLVQVGKGRYWDLGDWIGAGLGEVGLGWCGGQGGRDRWEGKGREGREGREREGGREGRVGWRKWNDEITTLAYFCCTK